MDSTFLCLLEAVWPRTSYLTFLSLFPYPFNRTNNTYTSQNCCENYILYVRCCSGCFTYTDAHNNPITIPILQIRKLRHRKNENLPVIQLVRASLVAQTVKNPSAMQKTWVRPGLGISRGGGHGNPLQYSCLENPMNRGAWRATVHGSQRVGHNWASMHSTAAYIPLYNIQQFLFLFTYHGHLGYHPFGIISNKTLWTFVHKPSVNTFSFLSFLFFYFSTWE